MCGKEHCYREITPYWRYATELFPVFKKKRIPIARFLCRNRGGTLSLLPIQLIPYFQYTVGAVLGTLLLGWGCRQMGQRGFHGASLGVDPDSLLTPWLVACWLTVVLRGFRRAHALLSRWYDLSRIRTPRRSGVWEEVSGYLVSLGWEPEIRWGPSLLQTLLNRYSRRTRLFIFGTPSQHRATVQP